MFETDHRIYYARLAAQATELGDRATDAKASARHHEMALHFKNLAMQAEVPPPDPRASGEVVSDEPSDDMGD